MTDSKSPRFHRIAITLALGAMLVGTAACNTVKGVGRDLESAADAVDRAT
ncbi:hypothetical protein [Novosphingobium aureum]|nr:hypothetical protein [Novosphingobium aureum]